MFAFCGCNGDGKNEVGVAVICDEEELWLIITCSCRKDACTVSVKSVMLLVCKGSKADNVGSHVGWWCVSCAA